MFKITADPERNRLTIILAGHLAEAERREAALAVLAGVAKLQPGFTVINDITGLHATDREGLKELARMQNALKLKGARRMVRVVKIPLSRIQFERTSLDSHTQVETVASLADAERLLDAPPSRLPSHA
ncbi:MAG TPA: hypothetical protein VJ486_02345 [Geothrix sp.]|nr:hypothetical protein [Geothrix sp.]